MLNKIFIFKKVNLFLLISLFFFNNTYLTNAQTLDVPVFSPKNSRWSIDTLGHCLCCTIGSDGCATNSKAMVFNYVYLNYTNPDQQNACLLNDNGYEYNLQGCPGHCLIPWYDKNNNNVPPYISFVSHFTDNLFMIINAEQQNGDIKWKRAYPRNDSDENWANIIQETNDGGYFIGGSFDVTLSDLNFTSQFANYAPQATYATLKNTNFFPQSYDAVESIDCLCVSPEAFSHLFPLDGTANQPIELDLDWKDSSRELSLEIYFGDVTPPPKDGKNTSPLWSFTTQSLPLSYEYFIFDGHDLTNNGRSDISVWRPSNGRWYIKDGSWPFWGGSGDIPVNGDYDGDGITEVAVWRPSNGRWYIKGQAWPVWGSSGDIPLVR